MDPDSYIARHWLSRVLIMGGRYDDAIEEAERALTISGRHAWSLGSLAEALGASGQRESAEAVYGEMVARARREYISGYFMATAAAAVGRLDDAMTHARRAVAEREPQILGILRLPSLAPLRDQTGYGQLLEQLGLALTE